MATPRLRWTKRIDEPRGVVLVLHGGRERSHRAVRPWAPALLRMLPFASAVAAAPPGDLAVAMLRYAHQGWNGAAASPLQDARAALHQVEARHPGVPVGLLGHSMGGRVALHLSDDARVAALVALAPWVTATDRPAVHDGLRALVMHGTRDRVTSAAASRRMAEAMAALGADVTYEAVRGEGHTMLRRPWLWHARAAKYLAQSLHPGR